MRPLWPWLHAELLNGAAQSSMLHLIGDVHFQNHLSGTGPSFSVMEPIDTHPVNE